MSKVSTYIVKEYFEQLGYFVREPCKYVVTGRKKLMNEDIELIVNKPAISKENFPDTMAWSTQDLNGVPRAVVRIYGWHSERFYPSILEQDPNIGRFISSESLRAVNSLFGNKKVAKILCISQLPAAKHLKQQSLNIIKSKGIDGVLVFPVMLLELINLIDANLNYERSDLLQLLRILKNYNLVKDSQLNLFPTKRRRKKKN
jgi:hypothetical protein